jgi:hypothetical protein
MRSHVFGAIPFFLCGFRARGFPTLPALPASSLDGKEGVDGSSPSEGFTKSQQMANDNRANGRQVLASP